MAILARRPLAYKTQRNSLFEVAAQITDRFDAYAKLFLEHISRLEEKREIAVEPFAKRGGPFWLALWKQIKKCEKSKELVTKFKWAAPVSAAVSRVAEQRLSNVIASKSNGFEHEAAILKLALGLIELCDTEEKVSGMSPKSLKVSFECGKSFDEIKWSDVGKPSITKIKCSLYERTIIDPRFSIPKWLSTESPESLVERGHIYWIGAILRASILGGSDFTGNRWKSGDTVTYKGVRTSWYKRRMGMMHSPETIVGEYATLSTWVTDLLKKCLQWPGFESTYVDFIDIDLIYDLQSLKSVLEARLEKQNLSYCQNSDTPVITTVIRQPKHKGFDGFRVVTVQQLLPRQKDFQKVDKTLCGSKIRAAHREHLMEVCQLTCKTLAAKLKADKSDAKPSADLIVFPELSVHIDDQDIIKRLADSTKTIIFAGMVFSDHQGRLVNFARWFIPDYRENGRQWIIRDQGKKFMTKGEKKLGIKGFRPCQHIIEIRDGDERPFRLTGAICYDATDLSLATDLRDKSDLFIVVAHNQDVSTFDNMAAALHYHMYQHVVVTNIGEFGGSTIQAPYKESYNRLICHVHGSEQIAINMADIDLTVFKKKSKKSKEVKTRPAGMKI